MFRRISKIRLVDVNSNVRKALRLPRGTLNKWQTALKGTRLKVSVGMAMEEVLGGRGEWEPGTSGAVAMMQLGRHL